MTTQQQSEARQIKDLEVETLQAILQGHKEKVVSLYKQVEHIYNKGSDYTRTLIANKFIFPLSQLLEMNYSWGKIYLKLFPGQLKTEYYRQTNSSGI